MILRELWRAASLATILTGSLVAADAVDLDVTNIESIMNAASTVAFDTMTYYTYNQSGQTPGKFNGTWWEGGALFMHLIQYWHFTGDTSYNEVVTQGMLWQEGSDYNYMPANSSQYLGNDDQVFWALAAITAAELKYPNPPSSQPSWLGLAQAVFNTQAIRWDTTRCGGGLRWQIWPYQAGYTTKNSVSNGGLFQLAARLGWYTGNSSYTDWAEKVWNWTTSTPLMSNSTWNVADTTSMASNCTDQGNLQWTYNYGIYLMGAAYMYNLTNGSDIWSARVNGLLNHTLEEFFPAKYGSKTMSEISCEVKQNCAGLTGCSNCDRNQACFKGLTSSWLGFTTYLVPDTFNTIMPYILASATAAAKCCSGGSNGRQCGLRWWQPTWDGTFGIEQEMSVLSVITHTLAGRTGGPPVTAKTGGNSRSQPGLAGDGGSSQPALKPLPPINTADRAGAGILTALVLLAVFGGAFWMTI